MVSVLRTKNADFGSGNFPPWIPSGSVVVTSDVACSGLFGALFAGEGTGMITQTNPAIGNRSFRLLFRAGTVGGTTDSALVVTIDFLNAPNGRLLKRVQTVVDPTDLPDVTGATPAPCAEFDLSIGLSPSGTQAVRITFSKASADGADILVDAIYLIESTVP